MAQSGIPFPGPGGQPGRVRRAAQEVTAPEFARLGLSLETVTLQNISLPEELQKILDQKIGMGMIGRTWVVHAVPGRAGPPEVRRERRPGWRHRRRRDGSRGRHGAGQTMAQAMQQGCSRPPPRHHRCPAAPVVALQPDEIMATLEKLADLKAKGILTDEEFTAKKTELLKKLV